jgi:hypothetical protein
VIKAFLRLFGSICAIVSLLHLTLGLRADVLLGAALISEPSLDSQNRFYGAAFMLFGASSWLCASDLRKYATLLQAMMAVFFVGGLGRILSVLVHGWPSPAIQFLALTELLIPPVLLIWHHRIISNDNHQVNDK